MDKYGKNIPQIQKCSSSEEVSSIERDLVEMSEPEQDIICRMHKLVGDKWELIAGRVPGRTAEDIERFWLMKINEKFNDSRNNNSKNLEKKKRRKT